MTVPPGAQSWTSLDVDLTPLTGREAVVEISLEAASPTWIILAEPLLAGTARARLPHPNIVLVSLDTLRADSVGCLGSTLDTTPNLDRLAAGGALFTRARASSGFTLPSHASILSGCSPNLFDSLSTGRRSNPRRPLTHETWRLPRLLQRQGYVTAGITGGAFIGSYWGFFDGFDLYTDLEDHFLAPGEAGAEGRQVQRSGFDEALRWIEENRDRQPFFLLVHTYGIHSPYAPPTRYDGLFAQNPGSRFADFVPKDVLVDYNRVPPGERPPISTQDLAAIRTVYARGVRWIDDELGRLLRSLAESQLRDNTLLFVFSDHGEEFLEHGRFEHRMMWDSTLRVPLVIAGPSEVVPPATRIDAEVDLSSLVPTILDVLDLTAPVPLDGASLLPLLSGGDTPRPAPSMALAAQHRWMVHRDGLFALHMRCEPGGEDEHLDLAVFDHRDDPDEQRPLPRPTETLGGRFDRLRRDGLVAVARTSPGWNVLVEPGDAAVHLRVQVQGFQLAPGVSRKAGRRWACVGDDAEILTNRLHGDVPGRPALMSLDGSFGPAGRLVVRVRAPDGSWRHVDDICVGCQCASRVTSPVAAATLEAAGSAPCLEPDPLQEGIMVRIWRTPRRRVVQAQAEPAVAEVPRAVREQLEALGYAAED